MNPGTGRFTQMDGYEGNGLDPPSIHKYTYASNIPVVATDPSGQSTLTQLGVSVGISIGLNVAVTALGEDHSPKAYGSAVALGALEGVAFFGAFKALGKVPELARLVRSAVLARQIQRTLQFITPLGARIPGFSRLSTLMTISTKYGEFFVSSSIKGGKIEGALKHIVGDVIKKSGGALPTELAESLIVGEIRAAIAAAWEAGAANGAKTIVRTSGAEWEILLEWPKYEGQLVKLFHMVPLRYFN